MAIIYKSFKRFTLKLVPLFLIFYFSLSEISPENIYFGFFSFNIQYIIIYFWVLKNPELLGYGFIFLAGLINDVVGALPLGISSLTFLIIALVATYIRHVTVKKNFLTNWITFIPAILLATTIYIFIFYFFSNYSVDYLNLLFNCFFTFLAFPIFWVLFEGLKIIIKGDQNA